MNSAIPLREKKKKRFFSEKEKAIIREKWPEGGLAAVRGHISTMTDKQIQVWASRNGVAINGRRKPIPIQSTEFIDAVIRREYAKQTPLKRIAKMTGREESWISYRATMLGVVKRREGGAKRWGDEEIRIIAECIDEGFSVCTARKKLMDAGYKRTMAAVSCRMLNSGGSTRREWMTAADVARLLGMTSGHPVLRWINKGMLKAKREKCVNNKEGDAMFFKITPRALADFLWGYPTHWDHRKMNIEIMLECLKPEWKPKESRRAA